MPSSTSNSEVAHSPRALPWAFVVALGLLVATEHTLWNSRRWLEFCARYAGPTRPADPLRTEARIRLLPKDEANPPILLIGSSQILEGLECEPFAARFPGRTCTNLGIAGGSPLDLLFLTDRIDSGLRRRTLITGLFPQTLHVPPKAAFSDLSTLRCLFRARSLFRLEAREWIDIALFGQMQNLFTTLRMKDALAEMWGLVKVDPLAALRFEVPAPPPNTLDQKPPRPRKYFRKLQGVVARGIAPGRFSRAHERALRQVIDREVALGNRMVVVDFPTREGYETTITLEAVEHHRWLMKTLAGRGDVVVVRASDLPPLSKDDFHDYTHVRASGRHKISERLAEILARAEQVAPGGPPTRMGSVP